jgi:N utilization substance protein B
LADDPAALDFAQRLFTQAVDRRDEIDALITRHTKNWAMHRIALVDLSVMRMAVAELLTFEDVPPKATIDEAIEIVKQYSTPKSGPFVNGVLDAALIDLEREGRLHKAGRGLVGIESIRRRAGTLESASS